MKKTIFFGFILISFFINSQCFSQSKFCANDASGKKYELNLTEGSGIISAKTYSNNGTLLNNLNGTWSIQDEGVYGASYMLTAVFSNANMKFFVIRDAKGNIEKLEEVVAGRVFYSCNNSIGGITNSNDDGSKYWWNQEKQSVDGKIVIGTQIWSDKNLNTGITT
jgi:hypothetical protein